MAESPFGRAVAVNLIGEVLDEIHRLRIKEPFLCGFTTEMKIYVALKQAGYLTEEAMVTDDDTPLTQSEPPNFKAEELLEKHPELEGNSQ